MSETVLCVKLTPLILQLYFIGSALSFYLVYDFCLYDGISAEVSYFLRYLPFITAVAVTILVVIFRYIYYINSQY